MFGKIRSKIADATSKVPILGTVLGSGTAVVNKQLVTNEDKFDAAVAKVTPENLQVFVRAFWGRVPSRLEFDIKKKHVSIPIREVITPPVVEFLLYRTLEQQRTGLEYVRNWLDEAYAAVVKVTDPNTAKAVGKKAESLAQDATEKAESVTRHAKAKVTAGEK